MNISYWMNIRYWMNISNWINSIRIFRIDIIYYIKNIRNKNNRIW